MKDWWESQTSREKLLIVLAGAVAAVVVLVQLVLMPLYSGRKDAIRNLERQRLETAQTLQGLQTLKSQAEVGVGGNPENSGGQSTELILSQTTSEKGLQIVRLQPAGTNEIMVWFDSASSSLLNTWIYEIETRHGLVVTALDLRKRTDGAGLRGSVTVSKGSGS